MVEPKQSRLNLGWAVSIVLLLAIDYFLSRPLAGFWDSLRERNSQAYLPLEWWMSVPFSLFMFAVLSAILTSFSGLKNWLKIFLLLCGFKAVFAGATAASLYFRTDTSLAAAASQAVFLSLPFVLVHVLLSGLAALFLGDVFAERAAEEVLPSPYFAGRELEEPPLKAEVLPAPPEVSPPKKEPPVGTLSLPVKVLVNSFPDAELAMSPGEIEQLSQSVEIAFDVILSQLPEGKVEVEALTAISAMPREVFKCPPEEVARQFPNGKLELPLSEVVRRVPPETFELPEQKSQPDVDGEFGDFFRELAAPAGEKVAEQAAPPAEEPPAAVAIAETVEAEAPPEEVSARAGAVPEEALVLTTEERRLLESSRDVVELSVQSVILRLPEGAVRSLGVPEATALPQEAAGEDSPHLPETVVMPLELIVPELPRGEVRVPAKFILAQFPKTSLLISEEEIIRSLPNGEVELPLGEIVPQLPPEVLAPPEQIQQPTVEDMSDPFREMKRAEATPERAAPPIEEEVSASASPAAAGVERAGPSLEEPPVEEFPPKAAAVVEPKEKPRPGGVSCEEMLRESRLGGIALSVETVVRLLPEGSLRVSAEEVKRWLGGETVKLPGKTVREQLKKGSVALPVEILTMQFSPEHFRMSAEEIKAHFPEGVVELPLPEIVEQVLEEIGQPPEGQKLQPECEEISTLFAEIPQQAPELGQEQPVAAETEVETESVEPAAPGKADAGAESTAEQAVAESVVAQKEEAPRERAATILQGLLQQCRGLGLSEQVCFVEGDNSVIVLAPSSLNREAAGCGMVEVMAKMRGFCEDYHLGQPLKLVISCSGGASVCRDLARGEVPPRAGLIVLASLNRSGAGTMSLLLDKLEAEPQDLSCLVEGGLEMGAGTCGPTGAQSASQQSPTGPRPVRKADPPWVGEEICRGMVAVLAEAGIEHYLVAETTPPGRRQKVVAAWGGVSAPGLGGAGGEKQRHMPRGDDTLRKGIFEIELLSRYCSEAGLGAFESLLLVTEETKVTLDRSPADAASAPEAVEGASEEVPEPSTSAPEGEVGQAVYLLCFFSKRYGEGLIRAKARKAVSLLTR